MKFLVAILGLQFAIASFCENYCPELEITPMALEYRVNIPSGWRLTHNFKNSWKGLVRDNSVIFLQATSKDPSEYKKISCHYHVKSWDRDLIIESTKAYAAAKKHNWQRESSGNFICVPKKPEGALLHCAFGVAEKKEF